MFVHQHQLEYQLEAKHYFAEEHHQREMEQLFLPGWHLIGSKSDAVASGDFFTFDLLGQPVLVRNFDGDYHAFLNVCSHRHSKLTSERRGYQKHLRCQYHGWEYAVDGYTRHIPDARCFRPFDRETAQLVKFRVEPCGELLFVTLSDEAPSLQEYLGEEFAHIEQRFQAPYGLNWTWEEEFDFNWKLPLENTLESYHIPHLHPQSFGGLYPTENATSHVMGQHYSTLHYDVTEDRKATFWQRLTMKVLKGECTDKYRHVLLYPNHVLVESDVFAYLQTYLPVSRNRMKTVLRMYTYRGESRSPQAYLLSRMTAGNLKKMTKAVLDEDMLVCVDQQRGLESSRHRGCIGTREERVYAFQRYIRERCVDDANSESGSDLMGHVITTETAAGAAEKTQTAESSAD